MKVFSAGLALSTALTAATLTLTVPLASGQDLMLGAYDPRQQETLWNDAIYLQSSGQHSEAIEKLKRADKNTNAIDPCETLRFAVWMFFCIIICRFIISIL